MSQLHTNVLFSLSDYACGCILIVIAVNMVANFIRNCSKNYSIAVFEAKMSISTSFGLLLFSRSPSNFLIECANSFTSGFTS